MYERHTLDRILVNVALRVHAAIEEDEGEAPSWTPNDIVHYAVATRVNAPYIDYREIDDVPVRGIEGPTRFAVDFAVDFYGKPPVRGVPGDPPRPMALDRFHDAMHIEANPQFVDIRSSGRDIYSRRESILRRSYIVRVMTAGANPDLIERYDPRIEGRFGLMADGHALMGDDRGLMFFGRIPRRDFEART